MQLTGDRVASPPMVAQEFDVDDLVGAAEIAERLGVKLAQTVRDWRRRHAEFPDPVLTLTMGSIWYWPDVEEWARSTGRLTPPADRQ